MPHDAYGLFHFHRRKRINERNDPYPHPDKLKRFVDRAIYVVALLGPVMTIPQILKIWVSQNATGVSLLSWLAYLFIAFFWVFYGILHREWPIIFANILWAIAQVFVVIGILLYGTRLI